MAPVLKTKKVSFFAYGYLLFFKLDKFGNLSVVRLPQNTNDDIEEDPTGTKSLWDRGLLSGASQKAECVAVCHLGNSELHPPFRHLAHITKELTSDLISSVPRFKRKKLNTYSDMISVVSRFKRKQSFENI